MPAFRFNDGEIELPDDWDDRTVVALSTPAGSKKPEASLAITRDPAAKNHSHLSAYVDHQLVDLAKTCPRFELVERKQIDIDGSPGQQLDFRWRAPDGSTVRQLQSVVLLDSGVALTVTATADHRRFADHEAGLRTAMQSLRVRR